VSGDGTPESLTGLGAVLYKSCGVPYLVIYATSSHLGITAATEQSRRLRPGSPAPKNGSNYRERSFHSEKV
jgi:hypothetical protein